MPGELVPIARPIDPRVESAAARGATAASLAPDHVVPISPGAHADVTRSARLFAVFDLDAHTIARPGTKTRAQPARRVTRIASDPQPHALVVTHQDETVQAPRPNANARSTNRNPGQDRFGDVQGGAATARKECRCGGCSRSDCECDRSVTCTEHSVSTTPNPPGHVGVRPASHIVVVTAKGRTSRPGDRRSIHTVDLPLSKWFRAGEDLHRFASNEQIAQWKDFSRGVLAVRHFGPATALNAELSHVANSEPKSPFAPLYGLWIAENCKREGQYEDALQSIQWWESRWADHEFDGRPLHSDVLFLSAKCSRLRGEPVEARKALERLVSLLELHRRSTCRAWFQIAQLEEEAGDLSGAHAAYVRAATQRGGDDDEHVPELARRNAVRIKGGTPWTRANPQLLATELMRALRRKDETTLWALASKTHFSLGQCEGHSQFADPSTVLKPMFDDLRQSVVSGNPEGLEGGGARRHLMTHGWAGSTFHGRTSFVLRRVNERWEWSGIGLDLHLEGTRELFDSVFGTTPRASNDDLLVEIKAPWPSGTAMQAGAIDFGLAVAAGVILGPLAYWLSSTRPCGLGPSGYYYNWGTHRNERGRESAFAIDFARYRTGDFDARNRSKNTPVLACADGAVVFSESDISEGSDIDANRLGQRLAGADSRYTARYLHFNGPGVSLRALPMSGLFIEQGTPLGLIDCTGNCLNDHLHFQINDIETPSAFGFRDGGSVRPSPMDGHSLGDADGGRCVGSSNELISDVRFCHWLATVRSRTDGFSRVTMYEQQYLDRLLDYYCPAPLAVPRLGREDLVCYPPRVLCGGGCVDLQSDPSSCGICGQNCGVDDYGVRNRCVNGQCVASGFTPTILDPTPDFDR